MSSFYILVSLLLLSGDVELNPGPLTPSIPKLLMMYLRTSSHTMHEEPTNIHDVRKYLISTNDWLANCVFGSAPNGLFTFCDRVGNERVKRDYNVQDSEPILS